MRRKQEQEVTLCRDCANAKPVTHEHLAHDGKPIFCTCDFVPKYHFLNHNVTKTNCYYFNEKSND